MQQVYANVLLAYHRRQSMYRTTKGISRAGIAGKKEFPEEVVKAFNSFPQIYSVPAGESGQNCAVLELGGAPEWCMS